MKRYGLEDLGSYKEICDDALYDYSQITQFVVRRQVKGGGRLDGKFYVVCETKYPHTGDNSTLYLSREGFLEFDCSNGWFDNMVQVGLAMSMFGAKEKFARLEEISKSNGENI